jgi:putative resolvase
VKLSTWAREQGISYQTACLWKAGKLPVPAEQLATGTVILHAAPANQPPGVALYARVSFADQKADLPGQLARLAGLHGCQALLCIFRNPKVQVIVVEHRDRLMRLGVAYDVLDGHGLSNG